MGVGAGDEEVGSGGERLVEGECKGDACGEDCTVERNRGGRAWIVDFDIFKIVAVERGEHDLGDGEAGEFEANGCLKRLGEGVAVNVAEVQDG